MGPLSDSARREDVEFLVGKSEISMQTFGALTLSNSVKFTLTSALFPVMTDGETTLDTENPGSADAYPLPLQLSHPPPKVVLERFQT